MRAREHVWLLPVVVRPAQTHLMLVPPHLVCASDALSHLLTQAGLVLGL